LKSITAVILAAGTSRRMGTAFKPLLPMDGTTVLEYVIETYRKAKIKDIRVVCGFRAGDVKPVVEKHDARVIENPFYPNGMLSSVKTGIRTIGSDIDGFFIHPVDIPLVRPETIKKLTDIFQNTSHDVFFPVFMDNEGHPPLISRRHINGILIYEGPEGLNGYFSRNLERQVRIPVCDHGILWDMDTPEEYQTMVRRVKELDIPTREECRTAMASVFRASTEIENHSRAVAKTALLLTHELEKKGIGLNKRLVVASALLHDGARGRKNHARVAADILRGMGFFRVADIVADHMDYECGKKPEINETAVVFLADKLILEDGPVLLAERFQRKIDEYAHIPEARENIRRRLLHASAVNQEVEGIIGMNVEKHVLQYFGRESRNLETGAFSDDLFDAAW
jgi:molybdenum cofactor cytidylyltransferase